MPLPKPKKEENRKDFISRCMGNSVMNTEFPKTKQRAGVCFTQWKNRKK